MDGMLSQDEINALLSGMDSPSNVSDIVEAAATAEESAPSADADLDESLLTEIERDAIGEVANISMGSSATTLYSLVNRKVNITTPVVTLATWKNVLSEYEKPCVFIQIKYTQGLDGSNILILKEHDVKVITDLMMGGDGSNTDGELGELHLSAISEAMNQMMGSAATSLSTMLGKMIDISPPEASLVDLTAFKSGGDIAPFLEETFCKIAFHMQIDELVDSTIMQLYPIDFAKDLYNTFIGSQGGSDTAASAPEPSPAPQAQAQPPQMDMSQQAAPQMDMSQMAMPQMQMGMSQMQMGMPQMQMGMPQMQMAMPQMQPNMNVQPAQFQSFANDFNPMQSQENISLIKDVPLEVTVELGRTSKSISDILDFAPGTIIELDKIAGEPIDVLVNGKFVAKGEVVVIEESFGVRVTEIVK
ncbi:MAG: flagellar motor switch phosphatase FliY [Clostridiales bacterium]|nr:flagellar motor switch phosphatase FliY [Clostridiales bacterium]